ncbi:MAG: adenylate/guanylate cyclase domain-containing protein [Chloroflexota bacterium]|nr:adenylate/guanylate cyclase domain-containing protein [Chloroflexota bacterium]
MSAPGAAPDFVDGTVMFTDIVGFTEFNALRGDAEALALLSLQDRIVRESLVPDSRVVKDMGDGLMLWFGDARDAIQTGLRLQERFEAESTNIDAPLWVRIGVHAGRQTCRGEDLLGHDVNIASRIMNLANSGEVLASEATVQSANGGLDDVEFEQLGPVVMKGIPTPINLFRAERAVV